MTDHSWVTTALPRARRRVRRRLDESGLTIIEVVVAIALLAVIIAPISQLVMSTGGAANDSRLRLEAANIASAEIDKLENYASFGNIPTSGGTENLGTVTVTENTTGGITKDSFNVTANWQIDLPGGATSPCSLASGSPTPPEVWRVVVEVAWPLRSGPGAGSVTEGTYVAPEAGGNIPQTSGEMAVLIENKIGQPLVGTSNAPLDIPITVVGTWVNGGTPDPPTGLLTESGDTNNTGCAVFPNLDPDPGYHYTATIENSDGSAYTGAVTTADVPAVVNSSLSTTPCVVVNGVQDCGETVVSGQPLQYGSITVETAPQAMDPGTTAQVTFFTHGFNTGCSQSPIPATCILPAADLPVTVSSTNLPNGTQAYDPAAVGQSVPINSLQLYPYNNYFAWAGDTADAVPPTGGVAIDATQSSPSVQLPVFPLVLQATGVTSGYALQATEYDTPQETIALSALTSAKSSTGVPLGQYHLTATNGHTVSPSWVWVTTGGVYPELTSQTTQPTTGLVPAGTPIPVTVT